MQKANTHFEQVPVVVAEGAQRLQPRQAGLIANGSVPRRNSAAVRVRSRRRLRPDLRRSRFVPRRMK